MTSWDSLVKEAHVGGEPYKITDSPVGDVEIPIPNGENYIRLVEAATKFDAPTMFEALFPLQDEPPAGWKPTKAKPVWVDEEGLELRAKMRKLFAQADFPVYDVLATDVIRYYFSQPLEDPKGSGV
jgi:hypothetical protein